MKKRVVFNIHGNIYRLIFDIEYRLKIIFIVWFGRHREYDKIDSKTISYDKPSKKITNNTKMHWKGLTN
ncbi:type II toxin-antitoxin system HigB family toxin [Algoriphagus boritolerans]|uniref:type II toxin-antitoxin system HigB family toxin n=1 Tax=Algoriphagus boritolerans TaxID=308111 RepID=UPI000AB9F9F0